MPQLNRSLLLGVNFCPPLEPSNQITSISNEMNTIHVEKNPAEQRLQQLGVWSWAIWTKEISSFPWHYDEQEICYFLRRQRCCHACKWQAGADWQRRSCHLS